MNRDLNDQSQNLNIVLKTNKITGKVLNSNDIGIPNLIAVTYFYNKNNLTNEFISHIENNNANIDLSKNRSGYRLGSKLTDQNGEFVFEYDVTIIDKNNYDCTAIFFFNHEDSSKESKQLLHISSIMNNKPGKVETFLIRMPYKTLNKSNMNQIKTGSSKLNGKKSTAVESNNNNVDNNNIKKWKGKFSEYYVTQQKIFRRNADIRKYNYHPFSLNFHTLFKNLKNGSNTLDLKITVDKKENHVQMIKSDGTPISLSVNKLYVEKGQEARSGVYFDFDEEKKRLNLCIPRLPTEFEHVEERSDLYIQTRHNEFNDTTRDLNPDNQNIVTSKAGKSTFISNESLPRGFI